MVTQTWRVAVVCSLSIACAPGSDHQDEQSPLALTSAAFWNLVEELSEPGGGYEPFGGYRADNLVSNERGVQHVLPALIPSSRGRGYVGVGPEQNFTYINALQPSIAFIVDVRRQNLLLHLMHKALAEASTSRNDYLSRLFARVPPRPVAAAASVEELFTVFGESQPSAALRAQTLQPIIARLTGHHRFRLSADDAAGIRAIYETFATHGPAIRWDPTGGAWIPTFAELMRETDAHGVQRSYLASEQAYRVFRQQQLENRIVPLVGDFGGTRALNGVARYLRQRNDTVGVFYLSNVEPYLQGDARSRLVANVAALPRSDRSLLIRTRFSQTGQTGGRPDFRTTTVTERMGEFVEWHVERPD